MAIETKEQYLERLLAQERPSCPNCEKEMAIWEVPPMTFSDGLGWGSPYLYVCFNDDCPTFKNGWENLEENFGHHASYRNICFPFTEQFEAMPVFSSQGGTGQVVTDEVMAEEERLKEATKRGFSLLAEFYTTKSWFEVLKMLLDATEPARVRLKAAEMIGDIGDLEAIEPLQNHDFGNKLINEARVKAVENIHKRFFTRECPHCAEIIKQRANVCKHCGKDLLSV
ncbi:MAG: zinc ribbon domain-containing protein [Thermodesulfobacteriota bacterium]|nr:zinc ribbon domain-containing protein [Thermodesulfobacteriota bacterium]